MSLKRKELKRVIVGLEGLFGSNKYSGEEIIQLFDLMIAVEKFQEEETGEFFSNVEKKKELILDKIKDSLKDVEHEFKSSLVNMKFKYDEGAKKLDQQVIEFMDQKITGEIPSSTFKNFKKHTGIVNVQKDQLLSVNLDIEYEFLVKNKILIIE